MTDAALTAHQIASIQTELRRQLGLAEERFPLPAFVGMVSDEIEQLHGKGRSDEEIAQLISSAGQIKIDAATITQHYAPPKARGHFSEDA